MDFTQIIIAILTLIGAGGIASFFTLKYTKKKAEAEAMASVQDVYQETIKDLRQDKEILKAEREAALSERNIAYSQILAIQKKVDQNTSDIEAIKRENAAIKAENEALKVEMCKNVDCRNRKK